MAQKDVGFSATDWSLWSAQTELDAIRQIQLNSNILPIVEFVNKKKKKSLKKKFEKINYQNFEGNFINEQELESCAENGSFNAWLALWKERGNDLVTTKYFFYF